MEAEDVLVLSRKYTERLMQGAGADETVPPPAPVAIETKKELFRHTFSSKGAIATIDMDELKKYDEICASIKMSFTALDNVLEYVEFKPEDITKQRLICLFNYNSVTVESQYEVSSTGTIKCVSYTMSGTSAKGFEVVLVGIKYAPQEIDANLVADTEDILPYTEITGAGSITMPKSVDDYDECYAILYCVWSTWNPTTAYIVDGSPLSSDEHFSMGNAISSSSERSSFNAVAYGTNLNISDFSKGSSVSTLYLKIVGKKYVSADSLMDDLVIDSKKELLNTVITENKAFALADDIQNYDVVRCCVITHDSTTGNRYIRDAQEITVLRNEKTIAALSYIHPTQSASYCMNLNALMD